MKTILVPTDFSNNAYCALFYSAKLFKKEPAHFIILNAFHNEIPFIIQFDIKKNKQKLEKFKKASEAKCLAVLHKLKNDLGNTNHTFKIKATPLKLTKAINKLINKENIDLVVMGSRGKTNRKEIAIGSNSFRVIKKINKTPLLVIPDQIDYKTPYKIGLATGLKYRYYKSQLKPLLDFTKWFRTNIKLIYISEHKVLSERQKGNFNHLIKISKENGIELNWVPETISKYDSLVNYIEDAHIDILALSYYKHNFIIKFLKENLVKDITHNITIPLLVLSRLD